MVAVLKHRRIPAALILALGAGLASHADAHPGGLDTNGCHYDTATGRYHCHRDPKRNREVTAPAKKSRENVCHDKSSPNYTTLKYFVSYPSLQACLASGGRAFGA
jgi:hypothetical protein